MNDNNFDKYLKISNLSLIITKIGQRIDFINNLYFSVENCIRESHIDFFTRPTKRLLFS